MRGSWIERRPLWAQILALTVFVLLLPVIGFLLANRFGKDLIEAEEQAVRAEAAALAAALEVAALEITVVSPDADQRLALDMARAQELLIAHAFSKNQNTRIRLYDQRGLLLIDSDRLITGILGRVDQGGGKGFQGRGAIKSFVPTLSDYRPYREHGFNDAGAYSEVVEALNQETLTSGVYSDTQSRRFRVLGVAPISSVQSVLGAVLINHDETGIEAALGQLNQRVFLIFIIAFGITILVSLILAGLIATPVTRLSAAARRLATKEIGPSALPTFPGRRDEIGDLALSLRFMARSLIERADASEAFAAEVAHELKNPLTSLRSAAETLSLVKDAATQEKLLALMTEDTDRLDRLISDISASSRLDAELARDEVGRADLIDVIGNFLSGQKLVDPGGIGHVRWTVAPDVGQVWVRSTPTRLVQLVQNLLSNALSFCPNPNHIDLSIHQIRPGWVRLAVLDQGPGLPPDKLDTIFKRFFTDRQAGFGKHSGLGLSIAQRIAESAGGRIWAENREADSGAAFYVDLPIDKGLKSI